MNRFPIKLISASYAEKFGTTGGNEQQAYNDGIKAALEYSIQLTYSGATVEMIRYYLEKKLEEAK